MKRIGNLWEQIISVENLELADKKARKGKNSSYGVRQHDKHRKENILALHEALKNKTFTTSPYTNFTVYEPKERLIYRLPYYPDRIVHHAVMNVLEPIFLRTFTHNTYSCIKGRGINGCMRQVDRIIRKYQGRRLYCLKIDIRKFYPSIDHEIMKQIVRKKIKDKDLLWLLDDIIDSAPGLPIGNYLSQYLANLYFAYFMHYMNEQYRTEDGQRIDVVEYADDICFFSDDKEALHECFAFIRKYIEERLNLKVKDNWQIFPIAESKQDKYGRALDYVGFQFFHGGQKLIRKSIKKRFCRACAKLNRHPPSEAEYKQKVAGWLGWAKYSNSRNLLKTIINKDYYESIL